MLQRFVGIVTAPCRHGVTFFPACCAIVDYLFIFVAVKALTLVDVRDEMISSQLFTELRWQRADVSLAAMRSVVKLGMLTGVAVEVLWFVVTQVSY